MKEGLSFRLFVHPIVCLFYHMGIRFLRIRLYLVICDEAGFFAKMMPKMIKKGQKTRLFGLFKKIKSLVLSGIVVK